MHFGAQVKEKRKSLRMTETECALRAGMKLQQWNRMEKTVARPAAKTVAAVAIGLMLDIDVVRQLAGEQASVSQGSVLRRVERIVNRIPADKLDTWYKIAESAAEALSTA